MQSSSRALLVTALLVSSAWAAPHMESFQVPKHGEVQLSVPDGWVSKFNQPPGEVPPTISLRPKSGQPFEVMITPYWRRGDDSTVYESALREQTEAAAAEAQSQAVEKKLTLKEISGTDGHGYYFTATDRAPKPGEYKYMSQGMLKLGSIGLAFTVLTNEGQTDVVESTLRVLSTAEHR
jgi:hypothetical protein